MASKKADDAFGAVMTFSFCIGILMFIAAWIHNELPSWLMNLIASMFHASPTGGR